MTPPPPSATPTLTSTPVRTATPTPPPTATATEEPRDCFWFLVEQRGLVGDVKGAAAGGPDDITEVGVDFNGQPAIERFDGVRTIPEDLPPQLHSAVQGALFSITTNFLGGYWAFGQFLDGSSEYGAIIEEQSPGGPWTLVSTGEHVTFVGGQLDFPTDGWAISNPYSGGYGAAPVIYHWDRIEWQEQPNQFPHFHYAVTLDGVLTIAQNDVWVAGRYYDDPPAGHIYPFLVHWDRNPMDRDTRT